LISFFGFFDTLLFFSKSLLSFNCHTQFFDSGSFFDSESFIITKKKEYLIKKKRNLIFFSSFFDNLSFQGFKNENSLGSARKILSAQTRYFLNYLYLPIISAQCISNFICSQIVESFKNKETSFKKSLKEGVLKMIQTCFNLKTIKYISGIKISCRGRWMKTSNGRSQHLKYSLGKINTPKINSFLDYGHSTATTPFGSCCLNVVICHKFIN
jgi:hypothetical protein